MREVILFVLGTLLVLSAATRLPNAKGRRSWTRLNAAGLSLCGVASIAAAFAAPGLIWAACFGLGLVTVAIDNGRENR